MIAYASRKLNSREINYCVTRKELLAVVYFLQYFRQYLLGRRFQIRTDHSALTWRTPDPIGQQARWLRKMEEFHFVIEHRKESRYTNADALSRRPCRVRDCLCRQSSSSKCMKECVQRNKEDDAEVELEVRMAKQASCRGHCSRDQLDQSPVANCSINGAADKQNGDLESSIDNTDIEVESGDNLRDQDTAASPLSLENMKIKQQEDANILLVIKLMQSFENKPPWESVALSTRSVKTLWTQWSRLAIRDGLLQRRFEAADGKSTWWQVIMPFSLRFEFMKSVHGGTTGGHMGRRRTAAAIQSRAYWPCWMTDLDAFLRQCEPCARYHRGAIPRHAGLQPTLVGEPWERVSIDITGPHNRSSRQNQYILTCVCHFSKWAEALPLKNHTATTVARALMTHIFSRFGAPF